MRNILESSSPPPFLIPPCANWDSTGNSFPRMGIMLECTFPAHFSPYNTWKQIFQSLPGISGMVCLHLCFPAFFFFLNAPEVLHLQMQSLHAHRCPMAP